MVYMVDGEMNDFWEGVDWARMMGSFLLKKFLFPLP
jgi:hypothetical protein